MSLIETVLAPSAQALDHRGAFGISVSGDGKPGSLAVFGFSWSDTARGTMLSSQNFVDAGMALSGNTVFTGVPVGASNYLAGAVFTPEVAVANFGVKPVNATVLFARTDESGPTATKVATVSVPAMSSKTVSLPPLTGDPGLRNSFIVQSDAAPGTFFSSVVSVGSSGFGLMEQIGKDQQISYNGGGQPWALTDGGQDAVLILFNHSTVSKYFNVKIGNGGVLWQQAWQLAPMETRAISIRELITGQFKDQDGVLLPKTLDHGEISWFTPNSAEGKGRLLQIERSYQLVAGIKPVAGTSSVARSFSCGTNIVLCGATLSTSTISFPFQTDSSPLALGPVNAMLCVAFNPTACSGQSYSQGGSGYSYSWQSNIPSIATISGSSTSSSATFWGAGVGIGSADGHIYSASCNLAASGQPEVCDFGITSPANGQVLAVGADFRTVTMSLGTSSTCTGSVSWTLDFSYTTSGGKGSSTQREFANSTVGQTISFNTTPGDGGQVTITAQATIAGKVISRSVTVYVVGAQIPNTTITNQLAAIYSTGARPHLMTGIATKESTYAQFANRTLFGVLGRWPNESFDGGSHIGLMMVSTNIILAYDWISNTQTGRDLFVNDKLRFSHNYVNQTIQANPGLRDLTGLEHEMNGLVFYGPFASLTQHYYEPNAGFTDWVINSAGNQNGVAYADSVVSLIQ